MIEEIRNIVQFKNVRKINKKSKTLKNYIISGLVDGYRIKVPIYAMSPNTAVKVYQQKYPKATDVFLIQDLFKRA